MTGGRVRRRCRGVGFDHPPTFFSIAKANELLRCPLCGTEVRIGTGAVTRTDD